MAANEETRIPKWLWSVVLAVLTLMGTGLGSTVGYVIYGVAEHERRITILESTQFTTHDGRALFGELMIEVKEVRRELTELRREFDKTARP